MDGIVEREARSAQRSRAGGMSQGLPCWNHPDTPPLVATASTQHFWRTRPSLSFTPARAAILQVQSVASYTSSRALAMLLFVDESGHDRKEMPYEVLAGVAIAEESLWNLVRAIRSAEREHFGDYLRNLLAGEIKGRTLLKTKRFKSAARPVDISLEERAGLANSCLKKGLEARRQGLADSGATMREMVAYSRRSGVCSSGSRHRSRLQRAGICLGCGCGSPASRARAATEGLCVPFRAVLLLPGDITATRARTCRFR